MHYDNSAVRRQDRLLDEMSARELLAVGEFGYLSLVDGEGAYGVPVSYAWDGGSSIYIHCAPCGRKLRCIDRNDQVSFCVAYESIVLDCRARCGLLPEERRTALELLLAKYSPADRESGRRYVEKSFARTEIIRLDIAAWSGKCKRIY